MARAQAAPAIVLLVVGLMMSCAVEPPPAADEAQDPRTGVPTEIEGWRAAGDWEAWDTESIFEYIDGHAEVYLAYGMKRCLSRRYAGPDGEPAIILDLYELASPADAFGVWTQDRDGDEAAVGQGAYYRHGWLSFWQGPWFGSIYAEGESEAAKHAVLALGREAAAAIGVSGEPPSLVDALPEEGLEPRTVRFLRTQEILNSVAYLGFDNPFLLAPEVDVVVGRYLLPEGGSWLLLADYPDESTAARAEEQARAADIAVTRSGAKLAAALEPETPEAAETLLAAALGGR
jgi:hypothetical protein